MEFRKRRVVPQVRGRTRLPQRHPEWARILLHRLDISRLHLEGKQRDPKLPRPLVSDGHRRLQHERPIVMGDPSDGFGSRQYFAETRHGKREQPGREPAHLAPIEDIQ